MEGFFQALLSFFLNIIFTLSKYVIDFVAIPFMLAVTPLFPNLGSYLDNFNQFCNDYIFKGLIFAREVFLNVTGYPRSLFYALITFFLGKLTLHLFIIAFKFIRNIIKIVTLKFDSN